MTLMGAKCPTCGEDALQWSDFDGQLFCQECSVMFSPQSLLEGVSLLKEGILAMNGQSRIRWADKVRAFLTTLPKREDVEDDTSSQN